MIRLRTSRVVHWLSSSCYCRRQGVCVMVRSTSTRCMSGDVCVMRTIYEMLVYEGYVVYILRGICWVSFSISRTGVMLQCRGVSEVANSSRKDDDEGDFARWFRWGTSLLFTISCRDALLKVGKCVGTSREPFLHLQCFLALAGLLWRNSRGYASRAFFKL